MGNDAWNIVGAQQVQTTSMQQSRDANKGRELVKTYIPGMLNASLALSHLILSSKMMIMGQRGRNWSSDS